MHWQITSPALILSFTAVLVAGTTLLIWHRRTAMGGMAIFWLMIATLIFTITIALEAASIGFDQKLFWAKLSFFGIAPGGPLLLIFSLVFTRNKNWITPRRLTILWIIPVIIILLATTNVFQKLIWTKIALNENLNLLTFQYGPAFWVNAIYAYLCVALADIVLIREYQQATGLYKHQILAIVASTVFPIVGNIIYLFGPNPIPGLDLTILSFSITSILITIAITQSRLFDLIPIAHNLLLQNMQDGVIVIDPYDRVVETNPSAAYLLDKLALPRGGEVLSTFKQWPELASVLSKKSRLPVEIFLPGSLPRYLEIRISAITDVHSNKNDGYLAVMRDVTDRKRAEAIIEAKNRELERLSVTDDLTGLYNRREANKFLAHEFQICERYGRPLSIVLLDIDYFKRINDGLGHLAGDEVIRSVANILRNNIRTMDLAARMGGDEFLMVMPDTDMDEAWPVVERIRASVQSDLPLITQDPISVSAGITCWFRGDAPDKALERVDRLLYQAKNQGKNQIVKDG
jgi:diguanylate cyclase (GGDEF)-like protein